MKKILSVCLCLALILVGGLSLAACGEDSTGKTYVVEAGGSIQEAINKASAGDSIVVKEGTYDEQLVIEKALTISGEGEVVISGPTDYNTLAPVANEDGETQGLTRYGLVVIKSTTATIKGITIKGEPTRAMDTYDQDEIQLGHMRYIGVLVYNSNVTLEEVTIKDILAGTGEADDTQKLIQMQTGYCVYVAGLDASTLTITECSMKNFQKGGIYDLTKKCTLTVTNTEIIGRGTIEKVAQNGIYSYSDKANIKIENNTISNMKYDPKDQGQENEKSTGVYVIDAELAAEIEQNNNFTDVELNVDHQA